VAAGLPEPLPASARLPPLAKAQGSFLPAKLPCAKIPSLTDMDNNIRELMEARIKELEELDKAKEACVRETIGYFQEQLNAATNYCQYCDPPRCPCCGRQLSTWPSYPWWPNYIVYFGY
jgi:hypothetical protein